MEQGTYLESLARVWQDWFLEKAMFLFLVPDPILQVELLFVYFSQVDCAFPRQWEDGVGANCKTRPLKGLKKNNKGLPWRSSG